MKNLSIVYLTVKYVTIQKREMEKERESAWIFAYCIPGDRGKKYLVEVWSAKSNTPIEPLNQTIGVQHYPTSLLRVITFDVFLAVKHKSIV